jgi:TolA-binding protein
VYNRIADVQAAAGMRDDAIRHLQQLIIRHPGTVEAANAERRCSGLATETLDGMEKGGRG